MCSLCGWTSGSFSGLFRFLFESEAHCVFYVLGSTWHAYMSVFPTPSLAVLTLLGQATQLLPQQAMSSDNLNNDVANMTVSDDSEGGAGPSIVPTSQKATWGSYIKQVRSFLVGMA